MASLYGYCDTSGCYVVGSTGTPRPATSAEAGLIQGAGGYGYIDTTDNAPNPLPPPAGVPPAPVSPQVGGGPVLLGAGSPPLQPGGPTTPIPPGPGLTTDPANPPPAPAAPAPDMSWRNNDQYSVYGRHLGSGSYFQGAGGQPLDTTQQLFYQTDAGRQAGYARFMSEEADPTSYYYRWLGNQQPRVEQDFRNASVADPNLQYTNYLDQQSKGLYDTYRNLPGWQQGMNPGVTWAGRRM